MRRSTIISLCAALSILLLLIACGGGGGSVQQPTFTTSEHGTVNTIVSDDATQDWATIGVKVLSITLTQTSKVGATRSQSTPLRRARHLSTWCNSINSARSSAMSPIPTGTYSPSHHHGQRQPCGHSVDLRPDPEPGFPSCRRQPFLRPRFVLSPAQVRAVSAGSTVSVPLTLATPLSVEQQLQQCAGFGV